MKRYAKGVMKPDAEVGKLILTHLHRAGHATSDDLRNVVGYWKYRNDTPQSAQVDRLLRILLDDGRVVYDAGKRQWSLRR